MSHPGTEDKFLKTLFPENMHTTRVLDVGIGYGMTGLYIRSRTYHRGWAELIGVEPFQEKNELQQRMNIYDKIIKGRGENLPLPDNSVNIVVAQHVLEHVDKATGYVMLKELDRVAKDRVIICTPLGVLEAAAEDGNQDNLHRSCWFIRDFTKLGYNTKLVTKNFNSRLLVNFTKLLFMLQGKTGDNAVIVAWKDLFSSPE